jgi:hypothetical protein
MYNICVANAGVITAAVVIAATATATAAAVVVVIVVVVVASVAVIRAGFTTPLSTRKLVFTFIIERINLDFGESIYKIRLLHPLVSAIFPVIYFNNVIVNKRCDILHIFYVGFDNIHHILCAGSLSSM